MKRTISYVFDWALDHRLIPTTAISPVKEIKFKKGEEKLPEILTLNEIKSLLFTAKRLDHPWFPIWALALQTGMRSGELYALTWDSVDLEGNLIFVHKNYSTKDREIGATKGRYWRTVPISSELKSFLLEIKLSSGGGHSHPEFKGDFVLPHFKAWNSGHQAGELRTFCEMSKMKSIGFHTLRACFATHLLNLNISTAKVMKICGWKELKTMERYIRLAGVEVKGITEDFKVMPTDDVLMGSVSNLIDFKKSKR
jgi:integrase